MYLIVNYYYHYHRYSHYHYDNSYANYNNYLSIMLGKNDDNDYDDN